MIGNINMHLMEYMMTFMIMMETTHTQPTCSFRPAAAATRAAAGRAAAALGDSAERAALAALAALSLFPGLLPL